MMDFIWLVMSTECASPTEVGQAMQPTVNVSYYRNTQPPLSKGVNLYMQELVS